jgi:hypothetical protein
MGSEEDAVFFLGSTLLGNGVELLNTAYLPMLSLSVLRPLPHFVWGA